MGHLAQLSGALQSQAGLSVERVLDGEGNAEPEFKTTIEPDERDTRDIAWTGDLAFKLDGGQELSFNALFVDTDRVEHEFERAFEAEDDDGDLDSGAEQTNQTDAFRERNWMLAATFTVPTDGGNSWELSASYDRTEGEAKETNYLVDMDFDFASVGLSDGDRHPAVSVRLHRSAVESAVPRQQRTIRSRDRCVREHRQHRERGQRGFRGPRRAVSSNGNSPLRP